jgi:S-adenosylmethionine synthetase
VIDERDIPIVVSAPAAVHPDRREVEIVERKGRGHPDSICDAVAEAFSISLTRAYQRRQSPSRRRIQHTRFGDGEVVTPFNLFLAGRATDVTDGVVIPVSEIAENAAVAWLHANLHALDVHRHVRIHPLERPGSTALSALVAPGQTSWVAANDTSFAVGHAPPSRLERVVLAVERALTSSSTIAAHPVIGEDVKVMGLRRGHRIDLTVACAMVDSGERSSSSRHAQSASRRRTHARARAASGRDVSRPLAQSPSHSE